MSRFRDIEFPPVQSKHSPAIYFRQVTLAQVAEVDDLLKEVGESADEGAVSRLLLWGFNNCFCNSDGEPFEDIKTEEDVRSSVGIGTGTALMQELQGFFSGGGEVPPAVSGSGSSPGGTTAGR